jgi:hypothetical protein
MIASSVSLARPKAPQQQHGDDKHNGDDEWRGGEFD